MKIKDLMKAAVDKTMTYAQIKEELKKLKLPEEEFEDYDVMFNKMLRDDKKILHEPIYQLHQIPNNHYYQILQHTINGVRAEKYSPEIAQELYDCYMLSPQLITYFLNEAISIVRMNSLQPEEIVQIATSYNAAMEHIKKIESGEIKVKRKRRAIKPKLKIEKPNINAEQVQDLVTHEEIEPEFV